jgi:hypothetical protein
MKSNPPGAGMTRAEFYHRQLAARRTDIRVGTLWVIAFFVVLFANVPLCKWVNDRGPGWLQVVYGVAVVAFFLGNFIGVIWWERSKPRRFGLLCGWCGAELMGLNAYVAVATGNCGVCGSPVFAEPSVPVQQAEQTAAPDGGEVR